MTHLNTNWKFLAHDCQSVWKNSQYGRTINLFFAHVGSSSYPIISYLASTGVYIVRQIRPFFGGAQILQPSPNSKNKTVWLRKMARTFLQQVLHCNYPNSKGLNVRGYAVRKYCSTSMFLPTHWRQEIMMEVKYFKLSCSKFCSV